ncbi:MAG: sulfurtransferase TusA family protein [Gemmataceae bacterium]
MSVLEPADVEEEEDDSRPLREMQRLVGGACHDCGVRYGPHDAIFSVAMGFKSSARCLPCLARGLNRPIDEFRQELIDYVHRRECYLRAWREADRMVSSNKIPTGAAESSAESPANAGAVASAAEPAIATPSETALNWDAGNLGCGDLVLALRIRLKDLPSGTLLTVRATDPAAPEDLPSWCRLTGHQMVEANHPVYTIRRK